MTLCNNLGISSRFGLTVPLMRIDMRSLFICILGLTLSSNARSDEVHSVCELLRAPEALAGKIIKIRGVYHGDSEGVDIGDPSCREPVVAKGQEWWPSVWIWTPGAAEPARLRGKVDFDERAYGRLIKVVREARRNDDAVTAIFEGRLEYCPVFGRFSTGRSLWIGCGWGKSILQLVVQTVTDIRSETRKDRPH